LSSISTEVARMAAQRSASQHSQTRSLATGESCWCLPPRGAEAPLRKLFLLSDHSPWWQWKCNGNWREWCMIWW
jgi:hypothetical protein